MVIEARFSCGAWRNIRCRVRVAPCYVCCIIPTLPPHSSQTGFSILPFCTRIGLFGDAFVVGRLNGAFCSFPWPVLNSTVLLYKPLKREFLCSLSVALLLPPPPPTFLMFVDYCTTAVILFLVLLDIFTLICGPQPLTASKQSIMLCFWVSRGYRCPRTFISIVSFDCFLLLFHCIGDFLI
jgi:hypothetical protein